MFVTIDTNAATPVFDQIAGQIATQVASGRLRVGERLPAARDLADALGVNVHTVLHAYQRLRDEEIVDLRRGRGAVVIGAPATERLHRAIVSVVAEARACGVRLGALIALIKVEHNARAEDRA